jgi:pimeloyl-ACP methyl ester carboxylesterase
MPHRQTLPLGPDRSLHTVTAGEGPDLVLLHGALATSHDWLAGPFDALSRDFRVTAIDRPGHGSSRRPRFEGTPRDQARQIKQGLDLLGIERPILVAHSFGALVALAYAELYPREPAALVLAAPLAFPEPRPVEHGLLAPRAAPMMGPFLSAMAAATVDRVLIEGLQALMFFPQPVPSEWKATFPYDQILSAEGMVAQGEDAAAILPMAPASLIDLQAVRVPVHILMGTADRIVSNSLHGGPLAKLLPDARIEMVEGAGHMVHHAAPETIIAAVRGAVAVA